MACEPEQTVRLETSRTAGRTFSMLILGALSLSIGWGIRGNFGHEYGAMIPGALAAIAVVLASGREDWYRRIAYFGFLGALGWSFGGSISYMQVIGYTHSGHLGSVIYGFACLFVIGFAWGAIGGAGTALPACISRKGLTELIAPIATVFLVWACQDMVVAYYGYDEGSHRHETPLYWFDTDWVAASLAVVVGIVFLGVRGRSCMGTSLVLYSSIGWWVGFGIFLGLNAISTRYLGFEFRMTPPRGDSWAGMLGMTGGVFLFCVRRGLGPAALGTLVSGFIGGFGFAMATLIKLLLMRYLLVPYPPGQGYEANYHSILEQTYGFINGIGIAVTMMLLASRAPALAEDVVPATGRTCPTTSSCGVRCVLKAILSVVSLVVYVGAMAVVAVTWMKLLLLVQEVARANIRTDYVRLSPVCWWLVSAVGLAMGSGRLISRVGLLGGEVAHRKMTEVFAVVFILLGVTYVNVVKNVATYVEHKPPAIPEMMYGLSSFHWFNIGYGLLAAVVIVLLIAHVCRGVPLVPSTWLGKGQLLYIVFLWWMVIANLMRAIPPFHPQRLITEGVIHVNAVLCTLLIVLLTRAVRKPPALPPTSYGSLLKRATVVGLIGLVVSVAAQSAITRIAYGRSKAPHSGLHVRFGPDATAKGKPAAGQPHP